MADTSFQDELDDILAVDLDSSGFGFGLSAAPPTHNLPPASFVVPDPDEIEEEDEDDDYYEEHTDEPASHVPDRSVSLGAPPRAPPTAPLPTPPKLGPAGIVSPEAVLASVKNLMARTASTGAEPQTSPVGSPSSHPPPLGTSPGPPSSMPPGPPTSLPPRPVSASVPSQPPPPLHAPPPILVPPTALGGPTSPLSPSSTPSTFKLEGRLFIKSVLGLPWKGWKLCVVSLQGNVLHYTREESTLSGDIQLTQLKKIGTKGIKELPPNTEGFIVTIEETKYCFYTEDPTQYFVWLGVMKNLLKGRRASTASPKKGGAPKGGPLRKSGSKKVPKKTIAQTALTTAKLRLGDMASDVTDPTYRFLTLLYHAKPTFINAIFAITQQADADKVAGYLARIFYFGDRALYLAHVVIAWEVENTTAANNLFRQNSIASKIMGAFSRLVAAEYLQQLLKPVVDKTIKLGKKLEVDPAKLNEVEQRTLMDNIAAVKEVVNDLLANIHALTDLLPLECRQLCAFLKQEVSKKFPEACDISIAGYLFLRLINPALVVPDGIGIVPPSALSTDARRSLVIVSKVVLNMATQVEFKKEEYMLEFNEYIKEKFEVMQKFYADAANAPTKAPAKFNMTVEPLSFIEEVARLYKILHSNGDKLIQELGPESPLAKEFKACIDGIGPPDQQTALQQKQATAPASVKRSGFFDKLTEIVTHFFKKEDGSADAAKRSTLH